MKYIFTALSIVLVINVGVAQDNFNYRFIVKYSPTSHLDPFAKSFQLSMEQRLNEQYSVHYGLGYVYNAQSVSTALPRTPKGYRSRIGLRYYKKGLVTSKFNFFHGPTIINRQTFLENGMTLCISPGCNSTILAPFVEMQTRVALTYGYGWHYISKSGFSMELEFLQGGAYRKYQHLGLPPIVNNPNTQNVFLEPNFFLFPQENGYRFAFHVLLRIGFGVKR